MVDSMLASIGESEMDLGEWGRKCYIEEKGKRLIEIEEERKAILKEIYTCQLNHSAQDALMALICYLMR